ncbi:hypothetical protein ACFL2H_05975, partial [Planctomycetota bacterium]
QHYQKNGFLPPLIVPTVLTATDPDATEDKIAECKLKLEQLRSGDLSAVDFWASMEDLDDNS